LFPSTLLSFGSVLILLLHLSFILLPCMSHAPPTFYALIWSL
jgi:hypothetical protein